MCVVTTLRLPFAGGVPPAPRYMDFLSLGVIVNAAAVAKLLDSTARPEVRRLAIVLAFAWFAQAAVGIDRLTTQAQSLLAGFRPFLLAQTANTRRFVLTDDVADLASKQGPSEIPYPDPYRLASLLREPALRGVLPAAVRQPFRAGYALPRRLCRIRERTEVQ